jgi:hypothetical protein
MEADVEAAVDLLLTDGRKPTFVEIKNLVDPAAKPVPDMPSLAVDLRSYDHLLAVVQEGGVR